VGLASLGSVWALAAQERGRAEWTRRSLSSALTAVLPRGVDAAANRTGVGLSGTVVVLETTLLLGAAGAHRSLRLWGIAAGLTAAYVGLTTPLLMAAVWRYWRWRGGVRGRRERRVHRGAGGHGGWGRSGLLVEDWGGRRRHRGVWTDAARGRKARAPSMADGGGGGGDTWDTAGAAAGGARGWVAVGRDNPDGGGSREPA